jgi:2-keto-4-pentenoate hydratase/2-oxohepta-3-ene-1,7-dioic acid hydratase in catechol pathway
MDRIYRIDDHGSPRHVVEREGGVFWLEGDLFGGYRPGQQIGPAGPGGALEGVRLLAPIVPSKIVAIGLNYRDHATETNKLVPAEPMIFLKPPSAVIGPGDVICIPPGVGRVDHEAEMAVVIGRRARLVPKDRAFDYVLGITCANDVTAREMQRRGVQYSHVKGFDTFAPLGPSIAVGLDPRALAVEGWVNGQRRQASNTRELIFGVDDLIAYISSVMTLMPGDVISTGTPSGIDSLQPGDVVTVKVEGVGELTNPVEALSHAGGGR